jgi:hypothetical protein
MAKESRRNEPPEKLKADIARSRDLVARDLRGLRYKLDISRKIRRSFREQTPLWLGAAVAVGVMLILLPARKKKIYVDAKSGTKSKSRFLEAGFALGALRIAASLLKPVVANFIAKRVGDYASTRHQQRSDKSF